MADDDRYKKREKDFKASVDTKRMFAKSTDRLSGDKPSKTSISSSDYDRYSSSFAKGDHLLDDAVRESMGPFMYVIDTLQGDIEDIHSEVSASVYDSTIGDFLHFETGSFTMLSSSLIPGKDNTFDLGSSNAEWKNLYVDGTANVDTLNIGGTNITATPGELNIMDGVTSTTAELNILDGVTSTAAELNLLDGITHIKDEDNMSSDSATSLATQQSIKAYVDANAGGGSGGSGNYDTGSHLIPHADNTYDLGSNKNEWKDLYVDGTAYIDSIAGGTFTQPLVKYRVTSAKAVTDNTIDARKFDIFEITANKDSTITGMTASHAGQMVTIVNAGSGAVKLKYSNKYANGNGLFYIGGADVNLKSNTAVQLICTTAGYWIKIA